MHYTQPEVYEFVSKQTNDPIVGWKSCRVSGQPFAVYQSDLDFYRKMSGPLLKMGVKPPPTPPYQAGSSAIPTPTLCPEERQRRRLMFRNERTLYKRKCDATGEIIVSIYAPDVPMQVYSHKFRASDHRDPLVHGVDIDSDRGCFALLSDLLQVVPSKSLVSEYNENCDYTSICGYCKNCYMTTASEYCEECMFGHVLQKCEGVVDATYVFSSQHCYDCVDIINCYACFGLMRAEDCQHCYDSHDLKGCSYCLDCHGLQNKSYCIANEQVSKDEFAERSGRYVYPSSRDAGGDEPIYQTMRCKKSEHVCGSQVSNAQNVRFGFDVENAQNVCYGGTIVEGKDLRDCSNCYVNCARSYEIMSSLSTQMNSFCAFVYNCDHCLYTINCNDSNNLFGCVGLRNKSYCIFNKQYTKQEYERLVPQIIEHMQETGERGEFFDPSLSPFGYNETVAQEYFPLTREEALVRGYTRQDKNYDPVVPESVEVVDRKSPLSPFDQGEIPADADVLKRIFRCELSGRPYRVIKQELDFYRKHNLPLPRKHPDVRHQERLAKRPGRSLHLRTCDCCSEEMLSVYAAGNQESRLQNQKEKRIYCESCYQREIYA